MPTYLENLLATRDQIAANLAGITAQPKPSYAIDGQQVDWQSLFNSYTQQLAELNAQIAAADPVEVQSRGTT
ncbi:MAG: hypothetical protein JSS27_02525 [Planctomycetes bacterium]|nr:hypothetical protein [Planctomycetota bacterium]